MYKYRVTSDLRFFRVGNHHFLGDQPLEPGTIMAKLELLVQGRVDLGGHWDNGIVMSEPGRSRTVRCVQRFLPPVCTIAYVLPGDGWNLHMFDIHLAQVARIFERNAPVCLLR